MAPLDFEMAQIVHEELESNGVSLLLEDSVDSIQDNGKHLF